MHATLPAAVLFDMDGTLIDSEPLWLASEHEVMAELGGQWGDADQAACLGGPLERVVDYMIERAGSTRPATEVMDLLLDTMEERLRATPLVWRPGARELLSECLSSSIPTALVSASWARLIKAVAERIDDAVGGPAFGAVVAGDDVEQTKPHPDPYIVAARLLGQETTDCLALEDSLTGVTSAAAAGCRVVAIPHLTVIDLPRVVTVQTLRGRSVAELWAAALQA
jgi:HAD superfamily hydrolase (TIGR01509 family)